MDPRYIEVVQTANGIELGCTQCKNVIFDNTLLSSDADAEKLTVFDLVRGSLRHSCATVERVSEIVSDATKEE